MAANPSRRLTVLAIIAALLISAVPAATIAASNARVHFAVTAEAPPPCPFEVEGGADHCLASDEVEFVLDVTNEGPASLTHVEVTAPGLPRGAQAGRIVDAILYGDSSPVTCDSGAGFTGIACQAATMIEGARLTIRVAFVPDGSGGSIQTITYGGISLVSKAASRTGSASNLVASCSTTCTDSVTFLRGQDADGTSYSHASGGQTTTVTLPNTEDIESLFINIAHLDGTAGFCGEPALSLGTCFGLTSVVEVKTADGASYRFPDCDLGTNPPQSCLTIELTWDLNVVPAAYRVAPGLISAYHDGQIVPKCLPSVEPGTLACSSDATITDGRVTITIWTAINGNWGAG